MAKAIWKGYGEITYRHVERRSLVFLVNSNVANSNGYGKEVANANS